MPTRLLRSRSSPVERDPQGNVDRYAPLCDDILRPAAARHVVGCITSWSRKEVIPVLEKARRHALVPLPLRGLRGQRARRLHPCLPQPAPGAAARLGGVPRFGAERLPARLQLHLGLGDQPRRARPDRRRRRRGARRALPAARRHRRGAADRRDPRDAALLHAQQPDRPVLLRVPRGLCRARPRGSASSRPSAARCSPAT